MNYDYFDKDSIKNDTGKYWLKKDLYWPTITM